MPEPIYKYTAEPTRNPFRYALALWRVLRHLDDGLLDLNEAAIVQIGFVRSRLGRRFARWEDLRRMFSEDPRTASALRERPRITPLDLEALEAQPEGTLGRVFAKHCRARGLDPNLVNVPDQNETDFMIAHLYDTHDIWHVVTGWGNDPVGEFGVAGFYCAQVPGTVFALLLALGFLNTLFFAPGTLGERVEALGAGYQMGKRAEPLFGVDWRQLWGVPLQDVRVRLKLDGIGIIGEGVRAAAA